MELVRRYRKRKKTRVLAFNPWNWDAEPGDLMITHLGDLMRLETPNSYRASAGELYPRRIKPPIKGLIATRIGDEIWWARKDPAPAGDEEES